MSHRLSTIAPPGPARKRARLTNVACESCRARKVGCDGKKPGCGQCSKISSQCVYKATADIKHTQAYVDSLVSRVSQLEQELDHARATILKLSTSTSNVAPLPRYSNIDPSLPPAPETSSDVSTVDAMGGDAGLDIDSETSNTFYGSSSSLGFIRQMYSTVLPKDAAPLKDNIPSSSTHHSSTVSTAMAAYVAPDNFSLLPRALADHLMHLYWIRVHVLYPFLHKASFSQAYEDLWKPSSDHHPRNLPGLGLGASKESGPSFVIFHCALNAALALGMQFSDLPLSEKERLSSACLAKSKDLLKLDLFDDGNLALVQTLLLLTQYFQSTNWPNKCWTSIGLACRLAQGLGLHIEDTDTQQRYSNTESELRRRVWHGCSTMDIIVSMTLGRPAMLNGTTARRLPGPTDAGEHLLVPGTIATKISSITFFTETVKLYRIVGRVLASVYAVDGDTQEKLGTEAEEDQRHTLLDLDRQLSQYIRELPKALAWLERSKDDVQADNGILARQSHVLHVRFLHARILLFRPAFLQYCRATRPASTSHAHALEMSQVPALGTSHAHDMAKSCVYTSLDLITAIEAYSPTEATGAWWYNVFYLRTAAMVILLSGVCPLICEELGNRKWTSAWQSCTTILTQNLPQFRPLKTCLATLKALRQNVLRQRAETGLYGLDSADEANEMLETTGPEHSNPAGAGHQSSISLGYDTTLPGLVAGNSDYLLDSIFDPFSFVEADLFTDFGLDFSQPALYMTPTEQANTNSTAWHPAPS